MVHGVDLELREHALEQRLVHDRAGKLALHLLAQRRLQRVHVEGNDRLRAGVGQVGDQAVANLAACAGDQHDRLTNQDVLLSRLAKTRESWRRSRDR